jgi:transcriptional regulator with XRE-family HTH domain
MRTFLCDNLLTHMQPIAAQRSPARSSAEQDHDLVASKAIVRVMAALELSQRELAGIIGLHESTISRLVAGTTRVAVSSKEGELALLTIRVYRSLDALVGGDDAKARAWLRAPNIALGGIPRDRMQRVEGLVSVAEYLDAMRGKL